MVKLDFNPKKEKSNEVLERQSNPEFEPVFMATSLLASEEDHTVNAYLKQAELEDSDNDELAENLITNAQ